MIGWVCADGMDDEVYHYPFHGIDFMYRLVMIKSC